MVECSASADVYPGFRELGSAFVQIRVGIRKNCTLCGGDAFSFSPMNRAVARQTCCPSRLFPPQRRWRDRH
jgi:hypothetical protein